MYDKMKGPGMTGLYASCGYTKYVKELDAYMDEHMPCVTDMDPLLMESYDCETGVGCVTIDECLPAASYRLLRSLCTH